VLLLRRRALVNIYDRFVDHYSTCIARRRHH
jgi:hypothetical protein